MSKMLLALVISVSLNAQVLDKFELDKLKNIELKSRPEKLLQVDKLNANNSVINHVEGNSKGCLYIFSDKGKCSSIDFLIKTHVVEEFNVKVASDRFTAKSEGKTEFKDFYLTGKNNEELFVRIGEKVSLHLIKFNNQDRIIGNGYYDDGRRFELLGPLVLEKK